MLGGVWLVYASFGLVSRAMAPLLGPIVADLDIGLATMGAVLGAWPMVYLVMALPAGAWLDRVGLRWGLLVGAMFIAVSGALRAGATGALMMAAAVAVFGIGGPLVSIGAPKLISQWFGAAERGTAMGIYTTGPSVGGVLALTTANSVVMPAVNGNWREALAIYALVALVAGGVWALVAWRVPPEVQSSGRSASERPDNAKPPASSKLAEIRALVATPSIRLVLALAVGAFFYNHAMANWLAEILRTGGASPSSAGFLAALPVGVGVVGALIIPRRAAPAIRREVLSVVFIAAGLGAMGIVLAGPWLWPGLILVGVARSAMVPVAMLVMMDSPMVGSDNMGTVGGLFFTAGEIGGVLGPMVVGQLAAATGGFSVPLWSLMGVGAILAATTWFSLPPSSAPSGSGE